MINKQKYQAIRWVRHCCGFCFVFINFGGGLLRCRICYGGSAEGYWVEFLGDVGVVQVVGEVVDFF